MLKRRSSNALLLTLLCAVLLCVRVTGVHLHLAVDSDLSSANLPLNVHIDTGAGDHHENHHADAAGDLDVLLIGDASFKSERLSLDSLLFMVSIFSLPLLCLGARPPYRRDRPHLLRSAGHFLRPPLRGPPPVVS